MLKIGSQLDRALRYHARYVMGIKNPSEPEAGVSPLRIRKNKDGTFTGYFPQDPGQHRDILQTREFWTTRSTPIKQDDIQPRPGL